MSATQRQSREEIAQRNEQQLLTEQRARSRDAASRQQRLHCERDEIAHRNELQLLEEQRARSAEAARRQQQVRREREEIARRNEQQLTDEQKARVLHRQQQLQQLQKRENEQLLIRSERLSSARTDQYDRARPVALQRTQWNGLRNGQTGALGATQAVQQNVTPRLNALQHHLLMSHPHTTTAETLKKYDTVRLPVPAAYTNDIGAAMRAEMPPPMQVFATRSQALMANTQNHLARSQYTRQHTNFDFVEADDKPWFAPPTPPTYTSAVKVEHVNTSPLCLKKPRARTKLHLMYQRLVRDR